MDARTGDPGRRVVRDQGVHEQPASLAARLHAGDASALRELFEQEGRRALGLATRVLGERAAAEDAVQEAFAQLWERAPRIDPDGGRIESLLMTMVHRRAIDLARARRRRPGPLPAVELIPQVDDEAQALLDRVVEDLSSEGLRARLRAVLASLPPEQRAVVEQAHFEGMTLREIAEHEGVPLGTVKSRLRLGMTKLTEALRTRAPR
jgi:RNA polymerase sigma-70 factor (ECF subfamily)